jgi:hypothetical protein
MDMPYNKKPDAMAPEHKILHGRFGGLGVVAAQGHQGVTGQREQLKTQIQNQEVLTGNHDAHTEQCKHCTS